MKPTKLFLLFTETGDYAKKSYLDKFGDNDLLYNKYYFCYPNEDVPDLIFINYACTRENHRVSEILEGFRGRIFVWLHRSREYSPTWIEKDDAEKEYYYLRTHSRSGPVCEALTYIANIIRDKETSADEYYRGLVKLADAFFSGETCPRPKTKVNIKRVLDKREKRISQNTMEAIYKNI